MFLLQMQNPYLRYNVGNALGGAGTGAIVGGTIGGSPGAAIGALLGGVEGAFAGGQRTSPIDLPQFSLPQHVRDALANQYFGPQQINPNALLPAGYQGGGIKGGAQGPIAGGISREPGGIIPEYALGSLIQQGQGGIDTQAIQNMAAPGRALQGDVSLQDIVSGKGGALDRLKNYLQGDFSGLTMGEQIQGRENLGQVPGQFQNLQQQAGLGQLGQAFDQFGNVIQDTRGIIGQVQNLQEQARQANLGNVGALRNQVTAGNQQFQNFLPQLTNLGGFDTAQSAYGGINQNVGTSINAANNLFNQAGGIGGQAAARGITREEQLSNLLLEDRALRGQQLGTMENFGIDPRVQGLADEIYNQQLQAGQRGLTTGPIGEQYRQQVLNAQRAASQRGLSPNVSSVSIDAQRRLQQEREAQNANLVNQLLGQHAETILSTGEQARNRALQAAGLLGQSSTAFAGQLPALINAATAGGGLVSEAGRGVLAGGELGANTALQVARGLTDVSTARQNAAAQGASQILAGNELTQRGLSDVAGRALAGDELALQSLLQSGQLGNQTAAQLLGLGQLGLGTQAQGFNQQDVILQNVYQDYLNKLSQKGAQEAGRKGVQFGG